MLPPPSQPSTPDGVALQALLSRLETEGVEALTFDELRQVLLQSIGEPEETQAELTTVFASDMEVALWQAALELGRRSQAALDQDATVIYHVEDNS